MVINFIKFIINVTISLNPFDDEFDEETSNVISMDEWRAKKSHPSNYKGEKI